MTCVSSYTGIGGMSNRWGQRADVADSRSGLPEDSGSGSKIIFGKGIGGMAEGLPVGRSELRREEREERLRLADPANFLFMSKCVRSENDCSESGLRVELGGKVELRDQYSMTMSMILEDKFRTQKGR
jgi:hypothetical protein